MSKRRGKSKRKRYRINKMRLGISAFVVGMMIVSGVSVHNVIALQGEQAQLKAKNKELSTKKSELTEELKGVNKDSYIIQQARTQLHMIRPGEVMYVLKDDKSNKDSSESN